MSRKLLKKSCNKGFTLIEMVVVVGVLGLIIGGLLFSLRQVLEERVILNKMKTVEAETYYITEIFSKDAQYSELSEICNEGLTDCAGAKNCGESCAGGGISFTLTEKEEDIQGSGGTEALYAYTQEGDEYYITRELVGEGRSTKLNTVPLDSPPQFNITRMISDVDENRSYLITISLVFKVDTKYKEVEIPVQTSVSSRLFEVS